MIPLKASLTACFRHFDWKSPSNRYILKLASKINSVTLFVHSSTLLPEAFKQLPRTHKWALSVVCFAVLLLALFPSEPATASRHSEAQELELGIRYDLTVPANVALSMAPALTELPHSQHRFTVKRGDNLALIFGRAGLSPQQTYKVSKAGKEAKKLLNIKPGEQLTLWINDQGQLVSLKYPYSATESLYIDAGDKGKFSTRIEKLTVESRVNFAQGQIESNFWNAGVGAGLSDAQIMNLAGIFGWDIDFALEIRQGDTFNVVYEENFVDGEFIGYGDIVAAEFVNQGETFQAIRHNDGNYYTPEGRSMRKSFLRAPVNFKYISSNFTNKRFHPVTKRWKAHRGTDYAADRGTPVMAAGDGKVIRARYDKYNGHHVFIQHGEKYTTKYLHFTKRAVKTGQHVKQGQVIGYVGSTGLASGPHLHYEFLVDGVHRNPRTVKLPKAKPIAKSEEAVFRLLADQRLQQLNNNKRIMLAMNN